MPQWPTVLVVVVAIILLGRIFCAWVCPTVVLRRIFFENVQLRPKRLTIPKGITWESLSPYAVLGGVLLASYLFKFPVFCLFCPIGILFAFIYALGQYFTLDIMSLGLLIFPIALIVELWVLKKWCRTICPIGALFSIIGNLNRFLIPTPREGGCLTTKGADCNVCEQVCPEGIPLSNKKRIFWFQSCTKCLQCYEKCPSKAVKIALIK
jgi:ferredoxin-type protein NapH